VFNRFQIEKLGFDRWNMTHLAPWLVKAGFSEQMIKAKFVEFGQGFQSMSPAMRDLEQVILDGKLAHGDHPVLSMCAHNTVVTLDDAGNRKPNKRKSTGRIDGLLALIMALGVSAKPGARVDYRNMIA
jgi:phage terminase large subunit-like protein